MNLLRLKQAESAFLERFPGGFENLELAALRRKRHNVDKMIAFAQEVFANERFASPAQIVESMTKVIGRSSVISVFEKARFRDFAFACSGKDRFAIAAGLEELLHGKEQTGFEALLELLQTQKLGKWPIMTICQTYYHPQKDVLVKPNTVKRIIQYFEVANLEYKPTPTWEFYQAYRSTIYDMKSKVDASLSPTNPAFSWFLLLSTPGRQL